MQFLWLLAQVAIRPLIGVNCTIKFKKKILDHTRYHNNFTDCGFQFSSIDNGGKAIVSRG